MTRGPVEELIGDNRMDGGGSGVRGGSSTRRRAIDDNCKGTRRIGGETLEVLGEPV